ncbi:hypothetical protein LUZ62_087518 [Rhynchospora pubera]|uniref:RNase H type-1 domain-containing protein n=1 Tax=Rhynchospora pubera TaxID=906938 RepID=A0AAV8CGI6_9POAL|nr:hypothetical protein LUZ62_087518 [Rhynchospora pubera]
MKYFILFRTIGSVWMRCGVWECFQGKSIGPINTLAAANYTLFNQLAAVKHFSRNKPLEDDPPPVTQYSCWIDASWLHPDCQGAGFALLIFEAEVLIQYDLSTGTATSPFHAELISFKKAMQVLLDLNIHSCKVLTDCLELKNVINGDTNVSEVEWQTYQDAVDAKLMWDSFRIGRGWLCSHVARELNTLADEMAKFARVKNIDCTGFTFPVFNGI